MAKIAELNIEAWDRWVSTRPPNVQALCRRFPPDRLYHLRTAGHRVTIYSYHKDGTLTADVTGEHNALIFGRRVFGISPDDLSECDLPDSEEFLGEMLTDEEDIRAYCAERRQVGA